MSPLLKSGAGLLSRRATLAAGSARCMPGWASKCNSHLLLRGTQPLHTSAAGMVRRLLQPNSARQLCKSSGGGQPVAAFSYVAFAKANPVANNLIIATCKTSLADLMAQCAIEKKPIGEIAQAANPHLLPHRRRKLPTGVRYFCVALSPFSLLRGGASASDTAARLPQAPLEVCPWRQRLQTAWRLQAA